MSSTLIAAFTSAALLAAQDPGKPAKPDDAGSVTQSSGSQQDRRFVDFHAAMDRVGFVAVVGTMQKTREDKRKRLKDGRLGNASQSVSVSGTQFFEVRVRAPIEVRAVLDGKPKGKVKLEFQAQLARLPSGKERRQTRTPDATELQTGMLALWILADKPKGRGRDLLHVIAFDPKLDTGRDPEASFVETMTDFVTINRRTLELEQALEAYDQAIDDAARKIAQQRLQELVEDEIELLQPELESLMRAQHDPWLRRVQKRIT